MTNSEISKAIAEAKDVNFHKSIEETFNFSYADFVQSLTGISAIYEFVNQQVEGWSAIEKPLPQELSRALDYFLRIRNEIVNFVSNYSPSESGNLRNYWSSIKNLINNLGARPIPYNSPHAQFLIGVYRDSPKYFAGAYNFIIGNNFSINSPELFYGAVIAYEFAIKDNTDITSRKRAEQKSLGQLKSDFRSYLSKSETTLTEYLQDVHKKSADYAETIDHTKEEKEKAFDEWFKNTKTEEWKKWYDEKLAKLQRLEETYEAKLKLEKPAKYWQTKSVKYYNDGNRAKNVLFGVVAVSAVFICLVLITSPNWIFVKVFQGNSTAIIRWSLLFIVLLTLIAFTVKALAKYMFSSFHLARDAEERHTLTFFYLALLKDTQVKDEDRKLILQSLFSRVETGLLKEDSSPTMPNDIVSKIVSR